MRKEPTDAEKKLWSLLRRGQINGLHFRQQVPIAGYIVDFCCLQEGIGVEADGGQHLDRKNVEYDNRRSETLTAVGIRILRFPDDEILRFPQNVQEAIFQAAFEKPPPQPSPGIPGAGE